MKRTLLAACIAAAALASAADAAKSRTVKACVIQPPYAFDTAKIGESVQWELDALRKCDPSLDLIVLPEASDRQGRISSREELDEMVDRYNAPLLKACAETARRCAAPWACGLWR